MSSEESPDLSSSIKFLFSAIIGVLLGGAFGAAYLIMQPVKEVTEIPEIVEPGFHYVLKGRTVGGDAWKFKATEFKDGKEAVTLLETELNRWAASFSTNYPDEKASLYLEPQRPIFRLEGDKLLVSANAEAAFGAWTRILTLSLEGDFIPNQATLQIEPDKLFIGSLRVPGLLKNFVWKEIASVYTMDEEFESLWSSVETANIHESQLILTAKR